VNKSTKVVLGHAHISEAPSDHDGVEVFETVFDGDWTRRLGRWIAVPAAEAADDPGGPSETVGRMWILEPFAFGFDILVEGGEGCDFVRIEGEVDRLLAAAIPRLQELDGNDGGFGSDGDELEEPVGGGDLAVFEPEALGLEDAEELLDQPALLVPIDDTPGLFCIRHGVGGEKPPVQRLGACLRIDLTHVDQVQRQAFWQMAQELALWPGQTNRAEAQFERHDPFGPLGPRRQHDGALVHDRHGFAGRIQPAIVRELAIMHAAGDHVEVLLGGAGIKGKDIALAVTQRRHHRGLGQQRLGRQRGGDPALRFLVRQFSQVMRDGAAALARPYLAAQQTEAGAVVGVYRQHRVQQQPVDITLSGLSEPAPALCRRCEVDLTGVLDGQHMAAFCRGNRAVAPAFDDALCRHFGIAEKPVEPHLPGAVTLRKPAQTDIFARDNAFDKRRPPLSRRRSPNRPSDQSICDSIETPLPKLKCRNRNHTDSRFWNPPQPTRVNPPHQMCACPRWCGHLSQPQDDCRESDDGAVISGGLFESGCDAAELLEF